MNLNIFEPKLIEDHKEYHGYKRRVTVDFYSNYKNFTYNQEEKLRSKGLIIRGGSFTYFKNNPAFKVACKLQTILSAN